VDILIIWLFPEGTLKSITIAIISVLLCASGYSFKDIFEKKLKQKSIKRFQNIIIERFNNYFYFQLGFRINTNSLKYEENEIEILQESIKNCLGEDSSKIKVNSLLLCYQCKKWDETKSPEDFQQIQIQSENLGIKYGEITSDVHMFLEYYSKLILKKENTENDKEIFDQFSVKHYKDLQFYSIKEELYQSKNLHDTLVKLIKDGKLSTYGINSDSLYKLQKDLQTKYLKQNTYLIFTNKIPENVRSYLKSLPGFSGSRIWSKNVPEHSSLFGAYIVRPPEIHSIDELIEIIKLKAGKQDSQTLIRIIPLDFLHSKIYTIPEDQSFTTRGLQESYETLEWFRTGYVMQDSVIWNEIAKSSISPNELLKVIPFNIFCPGIIPVEQSFLIKHYDTIKTEFNIEKLDEWRNVDASLMRDYILNLGKPEYSEEHFNNTLKLNKDSSDDDFKEAVRVRMLELCEQIKDKSNDFYNSMQHQN
jgi:hypothetical protein